MSFEIERGLFKHDFTDHHAILGVSVDADTKEVRKQYLKIARRLHPDSCKSESEAEKKQANELLTKLVNPAYEQLSRGNREYQVSLGHMGKRLATESGKVSVSSEAAKQLAKAGANLDVTYKTSLKNLSSKQYESLERVTDKIGEISELNLVYLMLKGKSLKSTTAGSTTTTTGRAARATGGSKTTGATGSGVGKSATGTPAGQSSTGGSASQEVSRVDAYIRRAEGYMQKNNFAGALLELLEALKLEQTNSKCHSLLGMAYLQHKQVSMAKVHINKALQLNPKDESALKAKQYIDKLVQKKDGSKSQGKSEQSGGGLFGGLFGGKKK
ncbi:DnaJ domain-containing protein [Coleofasciculus sp. LEGE 07081]|uniref:J domain-containing protein n=1 Tax=Coleofasciculus sp. LEGE 07081 TaxID=2777967 RepID=UPI001882ACF9|nr:DnaJ domain-containing protein [Coleofasciculus sp. LEGE 07081]MBE9127410.1 DnaJ domain-containing protein [Coleofasciculus sp. LEGE 07081]